MTTTSTIQESTALILEGLITPTATRDLVLGRRSLIRKRFDLAEVVRRVESRIAAPVVSSVDVIR